MSKRRALGLQRLGFDPAAVLPPEACSNCQCTVVVRDARWPADSAHGWRMVALDPANPCLCRCHETARFVARFAT